MNEACKSSLHPANTGICTKDDCGLTHEQQLKVNHDEVSRYKATMDRSRTRYQITEETEQSDGSVLVRVRKQYNDKADVSEYFN